MPQLWKTDNKNSPYNSRPNLADKKMAVSCDKICLNKYVKLIWNMLKVTLQHDRCLQHLLWCLYSTSGGTSCNVAIMTYGNSKLTYNVYVLELYKPPEYPPISACHERY